MAHLFKYKLVRISSADATSKKSNAEFSINFGKIQHESFNKCIGVKVEECSFYNIFYNIRTGINDVLKFEENGQATATITLDEGFYTLNDIQAVVKAKMDPLLIGGTVVLTLTPYSKKMVFTFTGTTVKIYKDATSTMAETLGVGVTTAVFSSVVTAEYIPKLGGLTHAYVHSRALGSGNLFDSRGIKKMDVLKVIPMISQFGAQELYTNFNDLDRNIFGSGRGISSVDIRLTNADNEVLNLQQTHFKLILKLFYL